MLRSLKLYLNLNLAGLFSPIQGWLWQCSALDGAQHVVETAVDYIFVENELTLQLLILKMDFKIEFLDLIYLFLGTKHIDFG